MSDELGFDIQIPEEDFKPPTPRELDEDATRHMVTFSELLDTLPDVDIKLKLLWKQIYQNAVTDRKNAMMVWADLYFRVHGSAEQHTMHGDHIAKYMERMEKANTQLLKLAELVQKVKLSSDDDKIPRSTELFDILEGKKRHS